MELVRKTAYIPFSCAECSGELYVGQPMYSNGRGYHAHIGCAVLAGIESRYGAGALLEDETLPPLVAATSVEAA